MQIETYIDSLVSYAMNCGLAEPVDHQVLTNRLLDLLHKDDYTPSDEPQSEDLEEILAGILDYACEKGLCENNITARDLFDTRIMGALTPMPREVIRTFWEKYAIDPVAATDWYYKLSSAGSEHLPYKQGVIGSNPIGTTTKKLKAGLIAQLVQSTCLTSRGS